MTLVSKQKAKRMMAIEKRRSCAKKNTLKGNSNAMREYKKTIQLNGSQKEVIVGTPFGLPAKR